LFGQEGDAQEKARELLRKAILSSLTQKGLALEGYVKLRVQNIIIGSEYHRFIRGRFKAWLDTKNNIFLRLVRRNLIYQFYKPWEDQPRMLISWRVRSAGPDIERRLNAIDRFIEEIQFILDLPQFNRKLADARFNPVQSKSLGQRGYNVISFILKGELIKDKKKKKDQDIWKRVLRDVNRANYLKGTFWIDKDSRLIRRYEITTRFSWKVWYEKIQDELPKDELEKLKRYAKVIRGMGYTRRTYTLRVTRYGPEAIQEVPEELKGSD
jgi:hypothetical protein